MPGPDHKRRLTAFVVAMAVLIVTPLAVVASDRFNDVPDSNIFHDDIAWLADNDVTRGCNPPDNDEFCPSDNVTRQQMAAFMRRLAENEVVDAATANEADHAATADDSDTLDGADSVAYRSIVAVDTHGFFTDALGVLAVGVHELATVDITVPAGGLIVAQGTASWESTGANDSNAITWIEMDTGSPCDSTADGDPLPGSFAETWVEGSTGFDSGTTAGMAAVEVGAAVTHTFYSCVEVQSGSINPIDRALMAEWTFAADSEATIASSGQPPSGPPADLGLGTK